MHALFWLAFAVFAICCGMTTSFAADKCPAAEFCIGDAGYTDEGDNCRCPSGTRKVDNIQGLTSFNITRCDDGRTVKKTTTYYCVGRDTGTPGARETSSPACNEGELATNFRWLSADSGNSPESSRAVRNILRASSVTFTGDLRRIRDAYKRGQRHNGAAAALIDRCDDDRVRSAAYDFAEKTARLKSCNEPPRATSGTCSDFNENLRWSLLDSGNCAPFSRDWLRRAQSETEYEKLRAEWIRRSLQVAQGHHPSIGMSADFISDRLLIQLSKAIYQRYGISALDHRPPDPGNPFVRQSCPGVSLFESYD